MDIDDHLALLAWEGQRLGDVAAATPMDAHIPGCPGWDVDALLRHIGDVHRWAASVVRERAPERIRADFSGPSDRDPLLAWYRAGHAELLTELRATTPDDRFWMWGDAPSPLAFWARRQAHETAVHRLDAEQAAGLPSMFGAEAAADGVDEWLMLASRSRRAKVPDGRGRVLALQSTDSPSRWYATLDPDKLRVATDRRDADCTVNAASGELFALVLNRRDPDGLDVRGDADVLRAWRESVRF